MKDVHTEHCCILHGCKYANDNICTVMTRKARQSFDCESCADNAHEITDEMVERGRKKYFEIINLRAPETLHDPDMVWDLLERVMDAAMNPRWQDEYLNL